MIIALMRRAVRRAGRISDRVRWRLLEALASRRMVRARGLCFTLNCDNWITHYRMESFGVSEPETLDWIDRQMQDGDVFFDVGGNIGVYSLYAALRHPRASVVVFEPEYANLHLLRDNILANGLSARVHVYPIALSDWTGVSHMHVQDLTPGAALHTESRGALALTETGQPVVVSEGTWAMRLDEFCAESGVWPNAMKIDVDGAEARVLAGAKETLTRADLHSVLIEAGDERNRGSDVDDRLREAGFSRVEMARRSEAGNEIWVRDQRVAH